MGDWAYALIRKREFFIRVKFRLTVWYGGYVYSF